MTAKGSDSDTVCHAFFSSKFWFKNFSLKNCLLWEDKQDVIHAIKIAWPEDDKKVVE